MLIYSLLHLTGYDLPIEELKNFRTHSVSNALTQRAGGGFYASGVAHFRVTWSFGVQP
jgi:molybdopterin/thiamine biosynthesis adenylyltransferase